MWVYAAVALLTVCVTLGLLTITKSPWLVTLVSATAVSGAVTIIARLQDGYWDPFAWIAFLTLWLFTALGSIALVGLGRAAKWPLFLG